MSEAKPDDVVLLVKCRLRYIKVENRLAYLAGAISGVQYAQLLINHGYKNSNYEIWSPFFGQYSKQLDASILIEKIKSSLCDDLDWLNKSFLYMPDLCTNSGYLEAVREYGPSIFIAFRFMDGFVPYQEIMQELDDHVASLLKNLHQLEEFLRK